MEEDGSKYRPWRIKTRTPVASISVFRSKLLHVGPAFDWVPGFKDSLVKYGGEIGWRGYGQWRHRVYLENSVVFPSFPNYWKIKRLPSPFLLMQRTTSEKSSACSENTTQSISAEQRSYSREAAAIAHRGGCVTGDLAPATPVLALGRRWENSICLLDRHAGMITSKKQAERRQN